MANRKPTDEKGYYRLLKVSPEASIDEIKLSYAMAVQGTEGAALRRLEAALETLRDPKRRAAYDALGRRRPNPLKSPLTLVACVGVLIAVFAWLWLPGMNVRRKSFRQGQTLVEIRSGREFGTIVRAESAHAFQGGGVAPAYLVRLADGGERWFPAIDLQATCDGR